MNYTKIANKLIILYIYKYILYCHREEKKYIYKFKYVIIYINRDIYINLSKLT